MRTLIYSLAISIVLISCKSGQEQNEAVSNDQQIIELSSAVDNWNLNDILSCKDINDIKAFYGEGNVSIGSEVVGEGEGTEPVTLIYPGTDDEVIVRWKDNKNFSGILSVMTSLKDREIGNWKLFEGIYLGMPLEDLVEINGKPIKFYGFDWDAGGVVTSFENGVFDGKNFIVHLTYDTKASNEKDIKKIIGDKEISTENNDLSKFKIKVSTIGFYNE